MSIEPEARKILEAMPVAQRPLWLSPLSMDDKTKRDWDGGTLDGVRGLLARKTGSVGIRFVHPQDKWYRMQLAASLARGTDATVVMRLDPWKPDDKTEDPFSVALSSRHLARLAWLEELAIAWRRVLGETPAVILLNHEPPTWRGAPANEVWSRLGEVRDILATELPNAELSWYNNQQRRFTGDDPWPFIPLGFSDQRVCSLYYSEILRAHETCFASSPGLDRLLTTCHTFDRAWAYEDAENPWGKRKSNPIPFTGERAEIYHRAVGRLVRNCHARVAYEPRMTVDWLKGLRAFIGGVNGK